MSLKEEWRQFSKNVKQDAKGLYEKAKLHSLISLFFVFAVVLISSNSPLTSITIWNK
jgi:hypothetical protein